MLQVSVVKRRAQFTLQATFAAPTPGVIALFGRSGSGKSTLIEIISGLLAPDEGEVRLDDETLTDTRNRVSVPVEQRRIGYVFQDGRLFPHLTVAGNLRYGEQRAPLAAAAIGFDEVVALLGLGPLLGRRPRGLSGGERQRVSLGRALLSQPRLLLLDEPLASLDAARREEVLPYLEALCERLAIPMIYVSHQFEEVLRLATHVVLLEAGRVRAAGPVNSVTLEPRLQSIVGPDLVGAVLEGVVTHADPAHRSAQLAVGSGTLQVTLEDVPVGARVRLQLLARDVILATQPVAGLSVRNGLAGTITAIRDDDYGQVLVSLDVGGETVLARITHAALRALKLRPRDTVWALVKAVSTRGHAYRLPAPLSSSETNMLPPHPPLTEYYPSERERRAWVRAAFDRSAAAYDRLESIVGLGTGSWYRRRALREAGLSGGMSVLDIGTGTGLLARAAAGVVGDPALVTGVDPSPGMIAHARLPAGVRLLTGSAEAIPAADGAADFLCMGYALRHLSDLSAAFGEFHRVLRAGGRLCLLEITLPQQPWQRALLRVWLRGMVPRIAALIAHGDAARLMRYYWDTIESCVPPETILRGLRAAGFTDAARRVELGMFSAYLARKPA